MIRRLLDAYHETTGVEGHPEALLLEALSSLELMNFLLLTETKVPGADIARLQCSDLSSIRTLATRLTRGTSDEG